MKKALLLGTSALVAAGLFAGSAKADDVSDQGVKLHLGGFMNQWFGYGDNDGNIQEFDQWSDTEIHFLGAYQMENGLEVGVNVQLEGNTEADTIDESYAYISGSFGQVNIGSSNTAAYLMQVAAPNVGLSINSGDDDQAIADPNGIDGDRNPYSSTFLEPAGANDSQNITYMTPRFNGFQAGVSYIPDVDNGGDTNTLVNKNFVYHDGISVGANYTNTFSNGLGLALAGGYVWANGPDAPGTDDFNGWSAGANLSYAGWTLGGSYARVSDDGNALLVSTEGRSYDVGLSYEVGAWGVSATYFNGEIEGTAAAGDDEHKAVALGAAYTLGQGVKVIGSAGWTEFEGELAGSADDNDGFWAQAGLAIAF